MTSVAVSRGSALVDFRPGEGGNGEDPDFVKEGIVGASAAVHIAESWSMMSF